MRLPKKIEVCPIVDTIVEIRFTTNIHSNAVFGLIYNQLKEDFSKVEKLPILQVPEQIRESDPGLKFQPYYKLLSNTYSVQIGPEVLSISSPIPYDGWENYRNEIISVFEKVFAIKIIQHVSRLGIRYVNFFDFDVLKKINFSIGINEQPVAYKNTALRTEIEKDGFLNTLLISNSAERNDQGTTQNGSLIDIDTFRTYSDSEFLSNYEEEIDKGREIEKDIFFSLLSDKLLNELNPTY